MKMRFITKTKDQIIFDLMESNYVGKTVGDLKRRLGGIPFVGLRPEEQCIQYDGVVLTNDMLLSDVLGDKRHVFVLSKANDNYFTPGEDEGAVGGIPLPNQAAACDDVDTSMDYNVTDTRDTSTASIVPEIDFNSDDDNVTGEVFDEEMELPSDLQCYYFRSMQTDENVVNAIVAMGYNVSDVRAALLASYNNPNRAIEYLVDGIPKSLHVALAHSPPLTPSRTPPPSYMGSMCSDVPTPPDPSSPALSSITSDSVAFNDSKQYPDVEGYDANDECENDGDIAMPTEQKRKLKNKYKRIAKAANWAASNTEIMCSASSTEDQLSNTNINASSVSSAPSVDRSMPNKPMEIKMDMDMDMDIDEQDYMQTNAAVTHANNN